MNKPLRKGRPHTTEPAVGPSIPFVIRFRIPILAALVFAVTFTAYLPALRAGFIWDDDAYLTNNPLIKVSEGLYDFWFTTKPTDYYPISNTSLWLEWRMWGMNATGYHCTNVLLHAITALLLWAALRRLSVPGAFLACLLFAVHPVNVEAVAWIAQRKDLLALMFVLLAIVFFLKAGARVDSWYALSLLAFVLAMLSKGSAGSLPPILLLVAYWKHGRLTKHDLLRAAPFFGLALLLTIFMMWFWREKAPVLDRGAGAVERVLGAGAVIWFYLYKALWPTNLVFVYPEWKVRPADPLWWVPLLGVVLASAGLWQFRRLSNRSLLFGWLFFLIALLPVMGFVDAYFMHYSLVADHYQHMAIIAPIAVAGSACALWYRNHRWPATVLAVCTVGLLMFLTHQQSRMYTDVERLYRVTIQKNPTSFMPRYNLGMVLTDAHRWQEAATALEGAIRVAVRDDDRARAQCNLGNALTHLGRPQEAISLELESLRLKPDSPTAYVALGDAFRAAGQIQEAIAAFRRAMELDPLFAGSHNSLGAALATMGQAKEAIEHYRRAIQINPEYTDAHYNQALALSSMGQSGEAIVHYQRAIQIQPAHVKAHYCLGNELFKIGHTKEAIASFQQAIQLDPLYFDARLNLGVAFMATGQTKDAISEFQRALQIDPDNPLCCNNLALIYAQDPTPQNRNGSEAVRLAQRAVDLTQGKEPTYLYTLALAYAEIGRFSDATATAERALEIVRSTGNQAFVAELEDKIRFYRTQQRDH